MSLNSSSYDYTLHPDSSTTFRWHLNDANLLNSDDRLASLPFRPAVDTRPGNLRLSLVFYPKQKTSVGLEVAFIEPSILYLVDYNLWFEDNEEKVIFSTKKTVQLSDTMITAPLHPFSSDLLASRSQLTICCSMRCNVLDLKLKPLVQPTTEITTFRWPVKISELLNVGEVRLTSNSFAISDSSNRIFCLEFTRKAIREEYEDDEMINSLALISESTLEPANQFVHFTLWAESSDGTKRTNKYASVHAFDVKGDRFGFCGFPTAQQLRSIVNGKQLVLCCDIKIVEIAEKHYPIESKPTDRFSKYLHDEYERGGTPESALASLRRQFGTAAMSPQSVYKQFTKFSDEEDRRLRPPNSSDTST
ncbi:hypothetical protein M3Y94_00967600 [Aphelenchoides besseyi]|nr:hypothetical protein M3Y94_00967600 [Aphelenchoides besseyi]KAI6224651.1 hypothetical protein M3Y95_00775300 [Aphelenchoides besseyi]